MGFNSAFKELMLSGPDRYCTYIVHILYIYYIYIVHILYIYLLLVMIYYIKCKLGSLFYFYNSKAITQIICNYVFCNLYTRCPG